jgi:methyl-accepting chemotaxis protein
VEVISVFVPLQVGDLTWAVMAEIDHAEVVASAAESRPALAVPLLLMYGLSLWSVWYWRAREWPTDTEQLSRMDFAESSDGGGLDG